MSIHNTLVVSTFPFNHSLLFVRSFIITLCVGFLHSHNSIIHYYLFFISHLVMFSTTIFNQSYTIFFIKMVDESEKKRWFKKCISKFKLNITCVLLKRGLIYTSMNVVKRQFVGVVYLEPKKNLVWGVVYRNGPCNVWIWISCAQIQHEYRTTNII